MQLEIIYMLYNENSLLLVAHRIPPLYGTYIKTDINDKSTVMLGKMVKANFSIHSQQVPHLKRFTV